MGGTGAARPSETAEGLKNRQQIRSAEHESVEQRMQAESGASEPERHGLGLQYPILTNKILRREIKEI